MTVLSRFFKMIPNHNRPWYQQDTGHHSRHYGCYQDWPLAMFWWKKMMTSIGFVALESFSSNLFGIATEIDSFAKIKCLLKYRQTHRLSNTPKFFEIWILKKILKLKYVEKSNVAQSNVKSFYGRQNDLGLFFLPLSWYFIRISTPSGGYSGEPRCKRAVPWEIL